MYSLLEKKLNFVDLLCMFFYIKAVCVTLKKYFLFFKFNLLNETYLKRSSSVKKTTTHKLNTCRFVTSANKLIETFSPHCFVLPHCHYLIIFGETFTLKFTFSNK